MALPLVPIGILWIIAAAATLGVLVGIVTFFVTKEGTAAIILVGIGFIAVLLVPFLPNRYKWVRDLKRKLRFVLRDDSEDVE
jgi:purine-cytosine permease-like protein